MRDADITLDRVYNKLSEEQDEIAQIVTGASGGSLQPTMSTSTPGRAISRQDEGQVQMARGEYWTRCP